MRYEIKGTPFPVVECMLDNNEAMITEGGSMVWMSPNMHMETSASGGFGRMLSGEKIFKNIYTSQGGPGMIAFGSSFPGAVRAIEITPQRPIIAQKSAFLAATEGVELSVHFQKKIGAGFFGGEGFIMQKISGNGIAFVEIDGAAVEYDLYQGQKLIVSTGNLAYADASVSIDIETVKGVKNVLFGGEGLFNTVLRGPGKVVLQSMPLSSFVATVSGSIQK